MASDVAHWMKSQVACCSASLACEVTAREKPPKAGRRPAGPAGSGATPKQSMMREVSGSVRVP